MAHFTTTFKNKNSLNPLKNFKKRRFMELLWIILIIILAIVAVKLFSMFFSALGRVLVCVLVVVVLYAAFAQASRDLVYSGYVFSDQSITIDSNPFIISFLSEGVKHPDSIQLNYHGSYFFVPLGSCKTVINIDFCFIGSIYDPDFGKFKANLTAYEVVPEIAVSRVIDKSSLSVGEEAEISVNVTNGIGIPADNFEFIDSFDPLEFELETVGGYCSKEGSSAVYRGSLRENRKISCNYYIKALKETTRSVKAQVSYFDGVETKYLFSSPINFEVENALLVTTYFNESDREVSEGDSVLFVVNLTNPRDDDLDNLVFNISLPSGLRFVDITSVHVFFNDTSNLTVQSQKINVMGPGLLQFSGAMKRNTTKFIALRLVAEKGGVSDIFLDAGYELNSEPIFTEKKDSLKVDHREIAIFTNFGEYPSYDSGEEKLIKIGVSNPSDRVALKNIILRVDTNLSNITGGSIFWLNETSPAVLVNQLVKMPYVESDSAYKLIVNVGYDTEYGEHFDESFEYSIVVDALAGLSITHDLSKTTVESGEAFTVKTKIKNDRNADVKNVRVFDVVPMEFTVEGLNSISNLNINGNEETTAYEYRMTAPQVAAQQSYSFRTTARYEDGGKVYAFEKTDYVTVLPKQKDLSIANAISDPHIVRGAILDVLYTIQNPDDKEALKDISVFFPVQQDIDILGQKNFTIGSLFPGESYTIRDVHRIRPKKNGSLTLAPAVFMYKDKEGNVFFKNSSEISFDADYGYISGPAFIVWRVSNDTVLVGQDVESSIVVKNAGSEAGSVKITDGGDNWNLRLDPGETDKITYRKKADREGILEFMPSYAEYFYQGRKFFTVSNSSYTNVTVLKAPEEKPAAKEVQISKITEVKVQRTFLQQVWDAVLSIFALFKSGGGK